MQYNIHDAKTHLSRLIERVEGGEEIVIGRAGRPVAKLVPYRVPAQPRIPGAWKGRVGIPPDFDQQPPEIEAAFRGILFDPQYQRLQQESARTGIGLGELVRRALKLAYGSDQAEDREAALDASFGIWADREWDGEEYVERLRRGLARRLPA